MSTTRGKILIVDDDEDVRWALRLLLTSAGYQVEAYNSGPALLEAMNKHRHGWKGCILADVRMPQMDGLALLERLNESDQAWPVIVMTGHGDIAMAVRAMKLGAFDFVEKPFDEEQLLKLIESALEPGEEARPTDETIISDAANRIAGLHWREQEILARAMEGKSNKVIAHELGLSMRTIELYRARLMARLGVRNLTEAARLAALASLATDR